MLQVTDIRQQRRKLRFNIYLDGNYSFSLPADVLLKSGLKIDQQIPQEKVQQLVKENEFSLAYDRVLRFLSFRPRSEKELRDWFRKKEIGRETQKLVWKKLQNLGYINDSEFAKWWIEQRQTFKPKGRRAIEMELRQKGVDRETIVSLLNGSIVRATEKSLANKAVEKKINLWQNLSSDKFRQKLTSFLARRGFSWETIEEVIDEILKKE